MKKAYSKPEAKKVCFQYTKVVAMSGGSCRIQYNQIATQNPNGACPKCKENWHYIGQHG
ncbi:MAG TPA: hypothetical protein PK321_09115 [Clostridia bacterium]|jgi:hypothetical protein|nr:hypothetical protein [Clostridia bacterium]